MMVLPPTIKIDDFNGLKIVILMRSGEPKKILKTISCKTYWMKTQIETLKELSRSVAVDGSTISKCLHTTEKIAISLFLAVSLLWLVVNGDGKWIYYDSSKRKKSRVNLGEPSPSTVDGSIHGHRVLLCIWWDRQGVVYCKLLKPNETEWMLSADVNAECIVAKMTGNNRQ